MKKSKLNKKKLTIFILLLISALSSLSFGIYSYAKYTARDSNKGLVIPATFQFSSNYLKESNPSYNVYEWGYGITIELYNSLNINKSEIDIPYTVMVTNGTSNVNTGIITTSEDSDTIVITPTDIESPVIVHVTSSIYNYTLSATFNLKDAGNNSYYTFTDKGNYSELVIKTSGHNINQLSVNWNSNFAPDNTNPLMETWIGLNGTLNLSSNTEYILLFFENEAQSYNAESAIITGNSISLP